MKFRTHFLIDQYRSMKLSNWNMALINLVIASVLAMLGLAKFGPIGLLCGVLNLVLVVYYLGAHK